MIPDPSHARPLRWLLLVALFIVVLGGYAHGQGFPEHQGLDEFSLDYVDCDHAVIRYYNSDPPNSARFPQHLDTTATDCGDLRVDIKLTVTSGPELIEVYPPPGWIVVGEPFAHVTDGEDVTIDITRYVQHGM
jgi:hypothetical protein